MIKKLHSLQQNSIVRGATIIFLGSLFVGFGNYLFNILIGRMLGPVDYGILASLLSLTYIIGVPSQTISLAITKYIANLRAKKQTEKIGVFIKQAFKKSLLFGFFILLFFFSFSFLIKGFFHLDSIIPVIILGLILLLSFISAIPTGAITGLEKFSDISINGILAVFLKIGAGVFLVYLGWKVEGALLAMAISLAIAIIHLVSKLKLPSTREILKINYLNAFSYTLPVFFASLCLTALYNVDVILTRHFLDPQDAGYYAALTLLGKIIFFATASIGTVLFPISAKNHSAGNDNSKILKSAFLLTLVLSFFITVFYFFFPEFIVGILLGKAYLAITPYIGWIGIIFILYSLINVLSLYSLSCNRVDFAYILFIGTALEILFISLFHSAIWEVIYVITGIMGLVLTGLIVSLKYKSKLFNLCRLKN